MISTLASPTAKRLILDPFQRFFQRESSGGIILFIAAIISLCWANSPWKETYFTFWNTQFTIGLKNAALSLSLHSWINDGLMAIFFFLVGLEIKRQLLVGELSGIKQALLPILAAMGGMVAPALLYIFLNPPGSAYNIGWGVPTVTDIAFSLGVLALLGKRVPLFLKVFLTAFAIADDLGAILIIALFYSQGVDLNYLIIALVILAVLVLLNRLGVRWLLAYITLGIAFWLTMLHSGIHPTIAGVLLALTIPATSKVKVDNFRHDSLSILQTLPEIDTESSKYANLIEDDYQTGVQNLETLCEEAQAPLQRFEHTLHPWVTYCIMPLFALANAGVSLSFPSFIQALSHPVALGILAGLIIGKTFGIFLFSWIGIKLKIVEIPSNIQLSAIFGLAFLGGIGFTMSLFIAGLAFHQPELDIAKIGTFLASIISGLVGYIILRKVLKPINISADL